VNRKWILLMSITVWAVMDLIFGDSLKPLIGQAVFGATCLYIQWSSSK